MYASILKSVPVIVRNDFYTIEDLRREMRQYSLLFSPGTEPNFGPADTGESKGPSSL